MPDLLPLSLRGRPPGRIRPELGPFRRALARLGDPQHAAPSILVVGTNGKGSTAAMVEALLEAHGVATGLTTSPHLVRVEERVRVRGVPVEPESLERQLARLAPFADLTFFEMVTAAAFLTFAEAGVEVAVLEAGMGGTWDATRAAGSAVAGLTNVGGDHAAWLGDSLAERARDKGAALAAARWAVLGPGVADIVLASLGAPHAVPAAELIQVVPAAPGRVRLAWEGRSLEVALPLPGAHQVDNLHLALALVRCAEAAGLVGSLDGAAVARGLAAVRWPGRLSEHRVAGRTVLLDGAHNLDGVEALAVHLEATGARTNLLFSCLDDKPVEAMAARLAPVVGEVAVCELADERAMPLGRLAAAFPGAIVVEGPADALARLPDPVLAAGSLRLVGALLELADEGGGR